MPPFDLPNVVYCRPNLGLQHGRWRVVFLGRRGACAYSFRCVASRNCFEPVIHKWHDWCWSQPNCGHDIVKRFVLLCCVTFFGDLSRVAVLEQLNVPGAALMDLTKSVETTSLKDGYRWIMLDQRLQATIGMLGYNPHSLTNLPSWFLPQKVKTSPKGHVVVFRVHHFSPRAGCVKLEGCK